MQDFLNWIYPVISRMPRSEKYTLGKRLEETAIEIMEGIIQGNYEINKIETLANLRVKLEILQVEIRTLKNIGVFSLKQYKFSSQSLNELKRILFGWMKSSKNVPVKQDGNAFGNYYFGADYEADGEKEEPEHTEENLKGTLKELNEKIDKKQPDSVANTDNRGRWLFSEGTENVGKK